MSPAEFASACMAYCAATNASVTSWGRTPAHNATVGGVPDSAHVVWLAADAVYDVDSGAVPAPEVTALRNGLASRLGLMLIHEGDHDHVQPIR